MSFRINFIYFILTKLLNKLISNAQIKSQTYIFYISITQPPKNRQIEIIKHVLDSKEKPCMEKRSKISTSPQSKAQEKSANFILGSSDSSDEESNFRPPNTYNYPPPRKKKCLHLSYSTPSTLKKVE